MNGLTEVEKLEVCQRLRMALDHFNRLQEEKAPTREVAEAAIKVQALGRILERLEMQEGA